jgi:hypothetical protein
MDRPESLIDYCDGAAGGEGDDALAVSQRQHFRKCGEPHVHLGVRGDLFTDVAPLSQACGLL